MKYQEQVNGMTRIALEQMPPQQGQQPTMAEVAMAQAAQQVLNANQAMGQAQSPEQQLVALKQAEVELEKEKLKMEAAKNSVQSSLDAQKLELEEAKLMKDAGVAGQSALLRKEKADLDRASKETMKALDIMTKASIADTKAEIDLERIRTEALKKVSELTDIDDRQRSFKLIDVMSELIKEEMKKE